MAYGVDKPQVAAMVSSFDYAEWFGTIARWIKGENFTRTVTAAYSATPDDKLILINGNITVTLPDPTKCVGKMIVCKAVNAGGGTRTVSGGSVNIDGAGTWTTTTQYDAMRFQSDGSQWWKV